MREVTRKYNVYEYKELKPKIQENLLEEEVEKLRDFYCWDCLQEDLKIKAKELLNEYFGQNVEFEDVYYDLSYCQGSGAMIDFYLTYYSSYIHIKHSGRYCHQNSFEISYANDIYLNDKREKYLKEKVYEMNCELTTYGYNLIDNSNFEDNARENLENMEFFENGEKFI